MLASAQGGVFSRGQALSCGYTTQQIQRRLGDGRWERIRYGQYAVALDLGSRPTWEQRQIRHTQLVHAAMNSMKAGSVAVSHQSALVLHGSPVWGLDLAEAHLTRLDDHRGGPIAGVRHHHGLLAPADLTEVSGLTATDLVGPGVSGLGVGGGLRLGGRPSGVPGGPSLGRRSRPGPC
ncbi:type IV toxin-antitoxin system AbiEi family antitoxin domain-containing protein [Kribbella caucasensis]|uniref:type IV toxin-antitoxin system AbiEi family antitoxin domain-containing protein n=1 Tax=Kribbella caucasensis TaxID=2512215 RepID=UPI00351A7052